MTLGISIHSQGNTKDRGLRLATDDQSVSSENSNAITLSFHSTEYSDREARGYFTVRTDVTIFGLSDTTAEVLHIVAKLSEGGRKSILPALFEALEVDETEPEEAS